MSTHAVRWMLGVCLAGLTLASVGCSTTQNITLVTGPRVNSYGLPASDTSGRALRVALISLDQKAFERLKQSESFRDKVDPDSAQPWVAISADEWFDKNADQAVRRAVEEADAIKMERVQSGQRYTIKLNHPRAAEKNAGVLVLADFSGRRDKDQAHQFETMVWLPAGYWFWQEHNFVVDIGEKTIRRGK